MTILCSCEAAKEMSTMTFKVAYLFSEPSPSRPISIFHGERRCPLFCPQPGSPTTAVLTAGWSSCVGLDEPLHLSIGRRTSRISSHALECLRRLSPVPPLHLTSDSSSHRLPSPLRRPRGATAHRCRSRNQPSRAPTTGVTARWCCIVAKNPSRCARLPTPFRPHFFTAATP
jgi:hypothetical protein